jgi:hypothetical protein
MAQEERFFRGARSGLARVQSLFFETLCKRLHPQINDMVNKAGLLNIEINIQGKWLFVAGFS